MESVSVVWCEQVCYCVYVLVCHLCVNACFTKSNSQCQTTNNKPPPVSCGRQTIDTVPLIQSPRINTHRQRCATSRITPIQRTHQQQDTDTALLLPMDDASRAQAHFPNCIHCGCARSHGLPHRTAGTHQALASKTCIIMCYCGSGRQRL